MSLYLLKYWDVNNLYGRAIKNYNEGIDEGYFLEVDVQYIEQVHELHNDLPFLPETMKIEKLERTCR